MTYQTKGEKLDGYTVSTKSKVSVETEGTDVHFRIRGEDGELLADTRLTDSQALHFGTQLINAAFEAKKAQPEKDRT